MGGQFEENIETLGFDYFSEDEIPELAAEKNNLSQIEMCFRAFRDKEWVVEFD